jgi:hypothetical protein
MSHFDYKFSHTTPDLVRLDLYSPAAWIKNMWMDGTCQARPTDYRTEILPAVQPALPAVLLPGAVQRQVYRIKNEPRP